LRCRWERSESGKKVRRAGTMG